MVDFLRTLPPAALIAIVIVFGYMLKTLQDGLGFILKEIWHGRQALETKRDLALSENTTAIIKLQVQIETLNGILTIVPKLKADIDNAHDKIRDMSISMTKDMPSAGKQ